MEILIGADPELFVKKEGKFHSAHGLVPGSKTAPFPVPDGAVQVDGMALEINPSPAKDKEQFVHNVESVLSSLREMLPHEYSFDKAVYAQFDETHMKSQPKEALALGCEVDFNAYEETQNPPPVAPEWVRTAGGHIHIGWAEDEDPMESSHFLSCCQITKQLDFFLGIPSVYLDRDRIRKGIYGRAGGFRPKPYGMEYRVLSNFWLESKELMGFVFSQTKKAFDLFVDQDVNYYKAYGENARSIINHSDIFGARNFVKDVDELMQPYDIDVLMGKKAVIRGADATP